MEHFANRPTLPEQVGAVLLALVEEPDPLGLRLNDLATITGLPTAHVGRHLRTLENDRLVGFGVGRWRVTLRGRRIAAELAPAPAPQHPVET